MKSLLAAACLGCLISACVSGAPDHYYILSPQPPAARESGVKPTARVTLKVSLPSWVDRSEIVLNTPRDGVKILEHERWAAPLTDLVVQTLGQDIERRRADVLVAGQGIDRPDDAATTIAVEVQQVTLRPGERASIETHWRIRNARAGTDVVGAEVFSAALAEGGSGTVARALSECLSLLAERLADDITPRQ